MGGITMPILINQRVNDRDFAVRPKVRVESLYTLFYQEKEPGFLFSGESHPVVELTYVDQGELHSVVDGQDFLLRQGDLTVYAPNQWHMQYADVDVTPRFLTISFDPGDYDLSPLYDRKITLSHRQTGLLQEMLRQQELADSFSEDMILCLLTQLLLSLLCKTETSPAPLQCAHGLKNENSIIRRAQQYIAANVQGKLSVPDAAKNAGVSASYLTALFHKHLQISPGDYIRRIKLQEAKQLIRSGTMNFTQISAALNYSTVHHFSRQFKENFGITPSEYARSIK
jgi:AraC-like DNA-binding protein